jgi:fused signal recognition particle receptor
VKFADKIKAFFSLNTQLNDGIFDDLCDLLVEGDFGAKQAFSAVEMLKDYCKKEKIESVHEKLSQLLEDMLDCALNTNIDYSQNTTVILLLGVNGVGKTTSAAKLSHYLNKEYGLKPILAAADTFRAAAIDQLKIHGEKLGFRVIAHKQGGDPAAVVYDALEASLSGNANLIIADTAGRMHTKAALVEELRKIDRVVEAKAPNARYLKYLALDATTGRNAFAQAEIFCEAVKPDGVILTKYDSCAKGGVVFSIASELKLPVAYICTGEKYTDIHLFSARQFAREFTGIA